MKNIKVLGTGCQKCKLTESAIRDVAKDLNIEINLSKIEDISVIVSYGVMSTPAVIIDDIVVHTGGVPTKEMIKNWL